MRRAAALSRFESRQWWSNPWFRAGVGFCALLVFLFGWVWAGGRDGFDGSWREWFVHMPIYAHPMVGMAVVAAHHAVTRRRDGVEELFESCPVDEETRTLGHLRSAWVPALVMVVFIATVTVSLTIRSSAVYGPFEVRAVADALAAVVLTVAGVWLGVALAHARRDGRVLLAGMTVAAIAVVSAVAVTRPLSDARAERLASMVAEPGRHQTCRTAGSVQLCTYQEYEDHLDVVLPPAGLVEAALPDDVGPMTLRQGFDGDLDQLGPEVAAALDRLDSAGSDGVLPLGFATSKEAEIVLRLTISLDAVGLPVEPPGGLPQDVSGEARGVVALWIQRLADRYPWPGWLKAERAVERWWSRPGCWSGSGTTATTSAASGGECRCRSRFTASVWGGGASTRACASSTCPQAGPASWLPPTSTPVTSSS